MSQLKFDIAEFLVSNKLQVIQTLQPDMISVLMVKNYYEREGLLPSYEAALADFVEYKLRWLIVDETGNSFDAVAEVLDKSLVADLYGEKILQSEGWEKHDSN